MSVVVVEVSYSYHGYHCGDFMAEGLVQVFDDPTGKSCFSTAGDTGDRDEETLGWWDIGEASWSSC